MVKDAIFKEVEKINIEAGGIAKNENTQSFVKFATAFKNECSFSESTKKEYGSTINKLIEYEKTFKTKLRFIDIDINFYNKFKNWMNKSTYFKSEKEYP